MDGVDSPSLLSYAGKDRYVSYYNVNYKLFFDFLLMVNELNFYRNKGTDKSEVLSKLLEYLANDFQYGDV